MAKSTSVDVDPGVASQERRRRIESYSDFLSECQASWIDRVESIFCLPGWQRLSDAVKGGISKLGGIMPSLRWRLNARVQRVYDRHEWLGALDARFRSGFIKFCDSAAKAYADMSWARVAILTIFLMALIGTADSMIGRPVSFRLIYMLPIWFATRLGGGGSGFIATLIVGVFCTIGDTPFVASREESQALNFAVRWISLGGFLLIVLQVEGALKLARQRATRDPLTGLANRFTIETMAEEAIAGAGTKPVPIHLALIDCDNFKELNDINGHAFGDHALKMLGKKLESETRGFGSVARLGGDEFIVLFQGVERSDAEKALEAADTGFKKLLASLDSTGGMSFGIATSGDDGKTYASLCRIADERMYAKKRAKPQAAVACIQLAENLALKDAC